MDMFHLNNVQQDKMDKNFIHKGKRVLPDLRTAIFANIKGYINGSYPHPLSKEIEELGYYPLSMATQEEIEEINRVESQIWEKMNGKNT